jgi:hypothetical protein
MPQQKLQVLRNPLAQNVLEPFTSGTRVAPTTHIRTVAMFVYTGR